MNIIKKNSTHKTYSAYNQSNYGSRFLLLSACIAIALSYSMPLLCLHGVSRVQTNKHHQTSTQTQAKHTQHYNKYTDLSAQSESAAYTAQKPSMRIRIKNSIINNMSALWRTIYGFFWTEKSPQEADQSMPQSYNPQSYAQNYAPSYTQSYTPSYAPHYTQSYPQQSYQANYSQQPYDNAPQQTNLRPATHNRSRAPRHASTSQQVPLRQAATNRHHRSSHQSPQAPTPITHRLRQYQIQATNQRDSSCGLHAAVNAQSVQRCISMGHPITTASVTQHHAHFYAQGAQFVGHINNLADNDIMRLVYTHFGMNNCCVMSMDKNICYTTYQSAQDIEWGVPDYSGSTFDNNAIRTMVNTLKNGGNGAVHFICHINQNDEHWILISLIKERNQYAIAYMDSQNRSLAQRPQAQRYINMLCEHYFTPLLG